MPARPPFSEEPELDPSFRRLLSRAEAATLIGMIVSVFSLFLTWERVPLKQLAPVGAMFAISEVTHSGLGTSARWPVTVCAALCSLMLLWTSNRDNHLPVSVIQGACGLTVLVIALTHLSVLPGVLLALLGGGLLTYGAVERFLTAPPRVKQK